MAVLCTISKKKTTFKLISAFTTSFSLMIPPKVPLLLHETSLQWTCVKVGQVW